MGLDNPIHIAFLVLILLLVFGAKRLPELGRSLGTGMREFKQSVTGETQAEKQPAQPMLTTAQPQPPVQTPAATPAPPVAQPAPVAAQPAPVAAQPAPAEAAPAEPQRS
jgi:sec-independent protein translocase protein TatA